MQRRDFLKKSGLAAGAAAIIPSTAASARGASPVRSRQAGVRHSVCKWCYGEISVAELARAAKDIGLASIELLGPEDWPTLDAHGLTCAMGSDPLHADFGIPNGFNRVEHHARLVPAYRERIREAARAGVPNVICFSGKRAEDLSDEEGLENCVQGLKKIMPAAEKHGVTVCMELLNSKVNHPRYMCDHTDWGVEMVRRVGSERMKLLYDIYHMQIMEGDVIRTIRNNHEYIAHYHTGGVPGRHEIDETQELYYPAIIRAIEETGFEGFVAQEFIPTGGDPLASLREGVEICTV